MPKRNELTIEESVLTALWQAGRSSEQLAKKLGVSLSWINQSCKFLKSLNMIHHENDLWRVQYRDGSKKKIVTPANESLSEALLTYKRKARNKATVDNQRTYSGRRGSSAEWKAGATMYTSGGTEYYKHLAVLGFTTLPTLKALKEARNAHMKNAHPDVGGSNQDAALINEAYEKLVELIGK